MRVVSAGVVCAACVLAAATTKHPPGRLSVSPVSRADSIPSRLSPRPPLPRGRADRARQER